MARLLIVYTSEYGQTQKIANFISAELERTGHYVEVAEVRRARSYVQPDQFDGVIVGAPIRFQNFSRPLKQWVRENLPALKSKPSAFFSVCLGILQNDPKVQEDVVSIQKRFFKETGWFPTSWKIFAGALAFTSYIWPTKILMKMISRRAGGGTDTRKDFEYTNWNEVQKFAFDFASQVRPARSTTIGVNYESSP